MEYEARILRKAARHLLGHKWNVKLARYAAAGGDSRKNKLICFYRNSEEKVVPLNGTYLGDMKVGVIQRELQAKLSL